MRNILAAMYLFLLLLLFFVDFLELFVNGNIACDGDKKSDFLLSRIPSAFQSQLPRPKALLWKMPTAPSISIAWQVRLSIAIAIVFLFQMQISKKKKKKKTNKTKMRLFSHFICV